MSKPRHPRLDSPLFPFFRLEWDGPRLTGRQVADLWTIDAYGAPFGVSKRQQEALAAKGLVTRVRENANYMRLRLTMAGKLAVEAGQRQTAKLALGGR